MSSMLDDDTENRTTTAREVVHKGKGCLAVLVSLVVLVGGGYLVWDKASDLMAGFGVVEDYPGPGKTAVTVTIPSGATLDQMGAVLVKAKVVKSTQAWNAAADADAKASTIQPGQYQMMTEMKASDAVALLIDPGTARLVNRFTVQEGLRLSAQITALSKQTKIPAADFTKASKDGKALGLPGYADGKAEGFLFPDTYEISQGANAATIMKDMVTQYKKVADDIDIAAAAKKLDRSQLDIVIVASIIEKEVRDDKYRAKVARVLYNRLDEGRKLQLDSTVVYAENLKTNTTTPQDRDSNSPYNTYKAAGLPPGPIAAPGKAALEAAANPASGDWLYFVTVNFDTGETKFGTTEADFNRIQQEFQQYCQSNPGKCDS